MRQGAVAAHRPLLGRKPNTTSSSDTVNVTSEDTAQNVSKNPTADSHASIPGNGAVTTDQSSTINSDRVNKHSRRPITARPQSRSPQQPIRSRGRQSSRQPAQIQTDFSSSSHVAPPPLPERVPYPTNSDRPTRSTRNQFPRYIDAIWSASQEEINAINEHLSSLNKTT